MTCEDRHLFGPIHQTTHQRRCHRCGLSVQAVETFEETTVQGNLEIYPTGLFSQWTHDRIRTYLQLSETDIILHHWQDQGRIYVFRQNP